MDINIRQCTLRFEQRGKSLTTGEGFKLLRLEGVTASDYDILSAVNPQMDGAVVIAKRVLPRQIQCEIDTTWDRRDWAIRFFNPKSKGRLFLTWNEVTRKIDYEVAGFRLRQNNVHHDVITLLVTLLCPQPFWLDMSDYGKNIAYSRPLLAFPFVWYNGMGMVSDYKQTNTKTEIDNRGDIETGLQIRFKAVGPVVNPEIILEGGGFVKVMLAMQAGDEMLVSTLSGQKGAWMGGDDVLNQIHRESSFFQLAVGKNILIYNCDEGLKNMEVYVYYTPKYLGV